MGHDSHGVMRIPEYLGFIEDGSLKTQVTPVVKQTGPGTAEVEVVSIRCGRCHAGHRDLGSS